MNIDTPDGEKTEKQEQKQIEYPKELLVLADDADPNSLPVAVLGND